MATLTIHDYRAGVLDRRMLPTFRAALAARNEVLRDWRGAGLVLFQLARTPGSTPGAVYGFDEPRQTFRSVSVVA